LKKIGEMQIEVTDTPSNVSKAYAEIKSLNDITIEVIDGKLLDNNLVPLETNTISAKTLMLYLDKGKYRVYPKYDINLVRLTSSKELNIDDLKFSNLTTIYSEGTTIGNLDSLDNSTNLTSIAINNKRKQTLIGDIKVFGNKINLTELTITASYGVYGDIKTLGRLTSLTTISFGETSVSGELEEFVANQINAGRTSGSILLYYITSTKMTFKGEYVSSLFPTNPANLYLRWNGSNDITLTTE
jgi:hypothetical protein